MTKTVAELKKILYGLGNLANKKNCPCKSAAAPVSQLGAVCLTQAVYLFSVLLCDPIVVEIVQELAESRVHALNITFP